MVHGFIDRFAFAGLVMAAGITLAGCSSPLDKVPRVADADIPDNAPVVDIAAPRPDPQEEKRGLFARFLRRDAGSDAAAPKPAEPVAETVAEIPPAKDKNQAAAPVIPVPATDAAPAQPKRLFGFLRRGGDAAKPKGAPVRLAALSPETGGRPKDRKRHRGMMLPEAVPGRAPAFGQLTLACHVKRGDLGKVIAKFPEKGTARFRLHDTAPNTTGMRRFHVTGFSDGCPRQLSAALVMFGSPSMYEALRFALPAKARSNSSVDRAYGKVKSRVCRVGRSKPCGTQIKRMEREAVFINAYDRFGGARAWVNILLHDGGVVAVAPVLPVAVQ